MGPSDTDRMRSQDVRWHDMTWLEKREREREREIERERERERERESMHEVTFLT